MELPMKISVIALASTAILNVVYVNGFKPQQASPYEAVEWKHFKGYSYVFIEERMGWNEARKQCWTMDADLASIHSKEENDFIYELVKLPETFTDIYFRHDNFTRDDHAWIGLTKVNGEWMWCDETPMNFLNWDPHCSEPNNAIPPENCAEIEAQRVDGGVWADVECWMLDRGFVCKKPDE